MQVVSFLKRINYIYIKLANHHKDKIQILLDINIEIYMF